MEILTAYAITYNMLDSCHTSSLRYVLLPVLFSQCLLVSAVFLSVSARTLTASSAVPGLFPTIAIKNHAEKCDLSKTQEWQILEDARIADNLGLRAMIDRFYNLNNYYINLLEKKTPCNIVIILVNAEVKHELLIEQSAESPSLPTGI